MKIFGTCPYFFQYDYSTNPHLIQCLAFFKCLSRLNQKNNTSIDAITVKYDKTSKYWPYSNNSVGTIRHLSEECTELWYKLEIAKNDKHLVIYIVSGFDESYSTEEDYGFLVGAELYDETGETKLQDLQKNNCTLSTNHGENNDISVKAGDVYLLKVKLNKPKFNSYLCVNAK